MVALTRCRISAAVATLVCLPGLLAAEAANGKPALWERLSKVQRAELLMTLLGLLLLLLLLILVISVGGRMARRYARHRPGTSTAGDDDWYRKPLAGDLEEDEDPAEDDAPGEDDDDPDDKDKDKD